MPRLNLAAWLPCTEVDGPGRRFAVWVQGCRRRCPGCCNPQMLPLTPHRITDASELMGWIEEARREHAIEGLTLLGGEPMLQAQGLAPAAQACQDSGLSVMIFTGYPLANLKQAGLPGVEALLAATDLVVDGPYQAEQPETKRNWAGSTNQQFHFLTDRYRPGIETDPAFRPSIEVRIRPDATFCLSGWPTTLHVSSKASTPSLYPRTGDPSP